MMSVGTARICALIVGHWNPLFEHGSEQHAQDAFSLDYIEQATRSMA